jgi:hypothetical protein
VINMLSQPINSSILKNKYQVKQETHMNKKKLYINLVQYLWLDLNQEKDWSSAISMYWISLEATWSYEEGFKRMSKWRTWNDVWDKIAVEEGITRTWSRWTIHRTRASGSLDVEEPYVMEKGKWIFNPRNQAYYEESYITKCQSLFNQEMKWLRYQKWKLIIRCEVLQATTSKSQCLSNIKCDNPHELKKRWSGKI